MPKKVTKENELQKISVRVSKINLEKLDAMEGTRSEKVNDAILSYLDKDNKNK